jgi:mono/diheme cytochrome c family protein
MHRSFAVAIVAAALLLVPAARSDAIPAFARKYQFSCSTCHQPAPRLKPFGEPAASASKTRARSRPARRTTWAIRR